MSIIEQLLRHKWHANAAYLGAVCGNEATRGDEELRKLFLHILVSNRFWTFLIVGRQFDRDKEVQLPDAIEPLLARYQETEALEAAWLASSNERELARELVTPRFPEKSITVAEALMQICLHSHGHRAQSAGRLRALGATPPATDFILWTVNRPQPNWDFAAAPPR